MICLQSYTTTVIMYDLGIVMGFLKRGVVPDVKQVPSDQDKRQIHSLRTPSCLVFIYTCICAWHWIINIIVVLCTNIIHQCGTYEHSYLVNVLLHYPYPELKCYSHCRNKDMRLLCIEHHCKSLVHWPPYSIHSIQYLFCAFMYTMRNVYPLYIRP